MSNDNLVDLLTEKNRKLFLGPELYLKCERKGSAVSHDMLQKRLNMWKSDAQFAKAFKDCTVQDVAMLCNLKTNPEHRHTLLQTACLRNMKQTLGETYGTDVAQYEEDIGETHRCQICLSYLDDTDTEPITLSCGHHIHPMCLINYLNTGNKICTLCKQPISNIIAVPTETTLALFKQIHSINEEFHTIYADTMHTFLTQEEIDMLETLTGPNLFPEDIKDWKTKHWMIMTMAMMFLNQCVNKLYDYLGPDDTQTSTSTMMGVMHFMLACLTLGWDLYYLFFWFMFLLMSLKNGLRKIHNLLLGVSNETSAHSQQRFQDLVDYSDWIDQRHAATHQSELDQLD
jgi:hypothetical protein